jgi:acyl carrier protein
MTADFDEFMRRLATLVDLPPTTSAGTSLAELELDSLELLSLAVALESLGNEVMVDFEVFSTDEFLELTLSDLFALVSANRGS